MDDRDDELLEHLKRIDRKLDFIGKHLGIAWAPHFRPEGWVLDGIPRLRETPKQILSDEWIGRQEEVPE